MNFKSIFAKANDGKLWAVVYPEHNGQDIFSVLLDRWQDTQFLFQFFTANIDHLQTAFWGHMKVDEAIDKIKDEAFEFDLELWSIETKQPGYENKKISEIFEYLHEGAYVFRKGNIQQRKARPAVEKPMIRIYALELSDGTLVVTGGCIKLTDQMVGDHFKKEFENLQRVQRYFEEHKISDQDGLNE